MNRIPAQATAADYARITALYLATGTVAPAATVATGGIIPGPGDIKGFGALTRRRKRWRRHGYAGGYQGGQANGHQPEPGDGGTGPGTGPGPGDGGPQTPGGPAGFNPGTGPTGEGPQTGDTPTPPIGDYVAFPTEQDQPIQPTRQPDGPPAGDVSAAFTGSALIPATAPGYGIAPPAVSGLGGSPASGAAASAMAIAIASAYAPQKRCCGAVNNIAAARRNSAYVDNFDNDRIEDVWRRVKGTWLESGGVVYATADGAGSPKNVMLFQGNTFTDVEVSVKIGPTYNGTGHIGGPLARFSVNGSGQVSGYQLIYKPLPLHLLQVAVIVDDVFTFSVCDAVVLTDIAAGDVIKLRIVGETLTTYINGLQIAQEDDGSYLSGYAGFNCTNAGTNYSLSNWTLTPLA